MTVLTCPSQRQLLDFLLGRVADGQARSIEEHVSTCTVCQTSLAGLDAVHDPLLRELQQASSSDPLLAEPELQQLLPRLEHLATPAANTTVDNPRTPAPETPSKSNDLKLNSCVGRYRILAQLGQGGMGTVYKAHDPQLNRTVAIKVPRFEKDRPDHGVAVQRFLREARLAAGVRHTHVCPIHDVGEHDGSPFVVMAFVEGQSLADRLKEEGRWAAPGEAVALVRQVAEALEAVHAHGIIHRDLKPGNILLAPASGRGVGDESRPEAGAKWDAVLSDFGLARPVTDEEHLTKEGAVVGTPAFMAPEQALNEPAKVGPWTDVYSLGVVLYQLLTGRQPFDGPPLAMLYKIAHESPPTPTTLRPDLDPALEAIVLKMMALKLEDRYQNARQVIEALDDWLTPAVAAPRPPHRRRWVLAAAAVLLALVPLTWLFGGMLLRIATNKGELVIEADDPNIEVTVKEGHATVYDKVKDRRFVLTAGDYEVEVREEGDGGVRFSTKKFTITRGGKETLNARLELAQAEQKPRPGGSPTPANSKAGTPLSPRALVNRPAALPGVRSWSLETTYSQEMFHMAFSPAGDVVATAGKDGSVRLYSADGTKLLKMLLGHAAAVKAVAWSPAGKTLASSGADQAIRLWDVATGRTFRTLPGYKDNYPFCSLAWSPDGNTLASLTFDRIDLWDMTKEKPPITIRVERDATALAWSPDSKLLVICAADRQGAFLQVLDGKTGQVLQTLERKAKEGNATGIAWSPDSKTLATAHYHIDPGLFLWDAATGKMIRTLKGEKPDGGAANVVWLDDGKTVVSMHQDRAQYWDVGTGKLVKGFGSLHGIVGGTCSRDGKHFAGLDAWGWASFFSPKATPAGDIQVEWTKRLYFWPGGFAGSTLDWSPDGMSLASHQAGGHIYLWDVQKGNLSRTWLDQLGLQKVAWSTDGKQLLACSVYQISRWNPVPPQGQLLSSFKLDPGGATHTLSPDRSLVAVTGADYKSVFLYDLHTGKRLHVMEEKEPSFVHPGPAFSWSPDGKRLAVALANGTVRLWDPAEGKLVRDLAKGHTKIVRTLAWSHDGKLLATAGDDDFLLLWDPSTGVAVRSLQDGHQGTVRSLAWSPDDKILYSSGDDRTVRSWKADTGKQLDVLDGQRSSATTIGLSPDGKTLAVLNAEDACIQVWDLPSRRLLGRLLMLPDGQYLAVSPDGHYKGSPKIDQNLVYVVETEKGQDTLTPTEFAEKYGWRNDPNKVRLAP